GVVQRLEPVLECEVPEPEGVGVEEQGICVGHGVRQTSAPVRPVPPVPLSRATLLAVPCAALTARVSTAPAPIAPARLRTSPRANGSPLPLRRGDGQYAGRSPRQRAQSLRSRER